MDNISILIVDDDKRNLYALKSYLEIHGMNVLIANNGLEALEIMKATIPDIILMDIMMPEMDGYETIKIIKRKVTIQSIPIIAVTAKAMVGDKEKCLGSGANDYISKPIILKELILKIKDLTTTVK